MKILLWIITLPFSLLVWPIWPKIKKKITWWNYHRRSGPKKYGKTLITRKPKLNTPAKIATFALENLSQIEWPQIVELENAIKKSTRAYSVEKSVMYGCRITQPVNKMVSLEKIIHRWNLAWHGIGHERAPGIYTLAYEKKWNEACLESWTPIYIEAIQRSLSRMKNPPSMENALSGFYPEISAKNKLAASSKK